jgi:uncharacterized membrane protein
MLSMQAQQKATIGEEIQPQPGSNVQRIIALSDCVIAVAFTLFVVNIQLPPDGLSESQLQSYVISNILPSMPFYLVSYLVVASSWISHYRILTYVKRSNSVFIMLNILFLASIVFLPVPLLFFYLYGNQAGVWQLFAATQVVTGMTLLLMWVVARGDHLLDSAIPSEYLTYTTIRLLLIPLGTLISLGVSFYSVLLAEGFFLCFYVLGWLLHSIIYRHRQSTGIMDGTTRMCSITDNMVAVAVTFLIAYITGTLLSNSQQPFSTALHTVLEQLPVYGFSLLIVGFYWLSHHRIFMVIRRHTLTLIWLNFAFLLFIELQPVFNSLRATYPGSQTTSILYASNQALTGLMILVIWVYAASRHRLIDMTMDRSHIISLALRALLAPLIFLSSIAVIIYRNDYIIYIWLLAIILLVADLAYWRIRQGAYQRETSLS